MPPRARTRPSPVPAVDALRAAAEDDPRPPSTSPVAPTGGLFDPSSPGLDADAHVQPDATPAPPAEDLAASNDRRVRALLAELTALPPDAVRAVLGFPDPPATAAAAPPDPEQQRADDVADGLVHLAWVIRRHPWLAPELWELANLQPVMILSGDQRFAVARTAASVGGTARPALYRSDDPGIGTTIVELGRGAVRLVLTHRWPGP